jgi:hypothetical protein
MVAASVDVAGSSPIGIKIPFFGNGTDIKTIEAIIESIRIEYLEDMANDLKLVFPSFPCFQEYASKGTDNKSVVMMIEYSFIGTSSTVK